MSRPSLEQRLAELEGRLDRLEGEATGAEALEAACALGALLRRRETVRRGGLERALARLEERAGRLLTAERVVAALAALDLVGLAREQRSEPEDLEGEHALAAALLEGRERAESLRVALRTLTGGESEASRSAQRDLEHALRGLDRLGQARLDRLLLLGEARRRGADELDPEAAADWWWRLRAECRPELLAAPAELGADERRWLEQHLAACPACREERAWQGRLELLLPGPSEGHPSAAQLVAHAAGQLGAEEREAVTVHLRGCPGCRHLQAGARAGLEEAARIEAGLGLLEALRVGAAPAATPLHLPLEVALRRAPRALAATRPADEAPGLADRRVLLEEPGAFRLVYFREGDEARIGLFAEPPSSVELELLLDGEPLAPLLVEPGASLFALGPAAGLGGRTLRVRLGREGEFLADRSFTMVEEP